MTTRDTEALIRKINAIKAKAECPSATVAEVELFMRKYNELMQQYQLTEDDLSVRSAGVTGKSFKYRETKHSHEMMWVVPSMERLTQTKAVFVPGFADSITFLGTRPDVDYAEFLWRLCYGAIEQSWIAYKGSMEYRKLHRQGMHGKKIRSAYRKAFAFELADRIDALARENQKPGKGLIVLKNELIQVLADELGADRGKTTKGLVKWEGDIVRVAELAIEEAGKVALRQQTETTFGGFLTSGENK